MKLLLICASGAVCILPGAVCKAHGGTRLGRLGRLDDDLFSPGGGDPAFTQEHRFRGENSDAGIPCA